jgi:predicted component of type VI protein secretion system
MAGCSFLQSSAVSHQPANTYTATSAIPSPAFPSAPAPSAPLEQTYKLDTPYYSSNTANIESEQASERKIVRTGSITAEVADIEKTQDAIAAIADQYNGYVVSSNRQDNGGDPVGDVSIRVPADKFDEGMQKLRALAIKVLNESTNSQDVTEQYTDLQAQLKNQQATEAQYLEILKKADNVKDILEVQKELSDVRGTIESLQGFIQYLDRTSDMSLIQITLTKSKPIGESTWDITGIFKSAVDGLITFGKALLSILIWLLVFSPVWIIILVVVWLILKYGRRSKKA